MRILDRYVARQLLPVWAWCLAVFTFLSCLIDLFEHLDEIVRFHIPADIVLQYYVNFIPLVFVRASPLALLLAAAFVATRLSRHQELLAMNASGTSLMRASVPFLFIGWLASTCVFVVNDRLVPQTALVYERLRQDVFRGRKAEQPLENVALMDTSNRLYHARTLDLKAKELHDLTVLEHDRDNHPTQNLYASRAIWTKHGWLLLYGRIYRMGPRGEVRGEPESFVERLIAYPVTPESFSEPEARPETMRYAQLRLMIIRLQHIRQIQLTNVRRYQVELASKLTSPLMSLIVCLIGFVGSTQLNLRGHLQGLGVSLGWGLLYYVGVAVGQGVGKEGVLGMPFFLAVWAPHLIAVWWCLRVLRRAP